MRRATEGVIAALATAAIVAVAGCAGGPGERPRASAKLNPTAGNTAAGAVNFVQQSSRVIVTADLSGLKPNAEHGFHLHERGNCSAPDATSAGDHWNPFGRAHGDPRSATHHAGDMPNIRADANGRASYRAELEMVTASPGPASVVGRAVVVHANPDDYRSQPAGNAGARIACGVVAGS